jgi:hypothetical protein
LRDAIDPWESRLGERGARLRKAYVGSRIALGTWGLAVFVLVILRNAASVLFQSKYVVVAAIVAVTVSIVVIFVVQFTSHSGLVREILNRTGVSAKRLGWENFFAVARYDLWLERVRGRQ